MTPLFQKLNLKSQTEIVVLDAPPSFDAELDALDGIAIHRSTNKVKEIAFALAFVPSARDLEKAVQAVLPRAIGDVVVWFAYPKMTSKKYRCDINRDTGWDALGAAGFEGVRSVAIDEDWSAVRFRRVEFIKTMKRDPSRAATIKGKERTAKRGGS